MNSKLNIRVFRVLIIIAGAAMFSACTTSGPATIDTSPEAEVTFDGLYPVVGGRMDLAWARADFDITKYSKIKLEGTEIEYRPGGEKRQFRDLGPTGHYYVTPRQKERFEEQMSNTFREELAKSEHFTIVEEAGPDVLLIRGGLYDVVSYVPPDTTGRSEIFISRIGEATLVFELRDSESDAILLRAIDRRAAQQVGGQLSNSNTVTNSSEFRRVAREWATILREGLDRFAVPEEVVGE